MPIKFHRPSFVKSTPALNVLTAKGAWEADNAINARQPDSAAAPARSRLGHYRARVSVLKEMSRRSTAPRPLAPPVLAEPSMPARSAPPALPASPPAPIPAPAPTITALPAPLLAHILATAMGSNPPVQVVNELRAFSRGMRESVDRFVQQSEQVELALQMTRQSLSNLARSPHVNDAQFQELVRQLIARNTHIGLRLSDIASAARRQCVMASLASVTHLRSVDLDASEMPESFPAVVAAINAVGNGNHHLTRFGLNVHDSDIGDAGARVLAAIPTITVLDASLNNIHAEGANALAANTTITSLDLSFNHLGDAGARILAAGTSMMRLDLSANDIGNEGAQALAASGTIRELRVTHNDVGDTGALALGANTTLTELDASFNNIGNAGVRALAANTSIRWLNVGFNHFGEAGDQAIEQRRRRLQAIPLPG
jgi:hypothetical protein